MASTKENCWIGFDLGGTKMLSCAYDNEFSVLGRERKKTKGHVGAEAGVERIIETIEATLDDGKLKANQLLGIGIGCPGPVNPDQGELLFAPNLGWRNVPLKKQLEKHFECPVVVANDVDLGVYGEYRFGTAQQARCVIGVFPGTGIGGGCVYEGRIFRGRAITCMEIGHIPSLTDGPVSSAGHQGSLESVAGRLYIASAAAQASYRGQAPHLREVAGTDLSLIRSGVLAESIKKGDVAIKRIVHTAGKRIGTSIAGLIHIMAPDHIVLGGGLVEALPKYFLESVQEGIESWLLPEYQGSYKLEVATLGDDAAVLGAAAWARHIITSDGSES